MLYSLNDIKIFIPTYDRPEYLRESLKSLVNQSAGCPDIVVYNNGELEETSNVIREFKDYGVKEKHSKGGLLECMDDVQKYVDSKYVMFFHDDDILNSKYLEYAIKALNTYDNVSLITTKAKNFYDGDVINSEDACEEHYFFNNQESFADYLYLYEQVAMQTAIYRTDLFKKYPRENNKYGKFFDWPYLILFSKLGNTVLFCDEKMFNVRIHKSQWTNDKKSSWNVKHLIGWHKCFAEAMNVNKQNSMGAVIFAYKFMGLISEQYKGLASDEDKKNYPPDKMLEDATLEIGADIERYQTPYNKFLTKVLIKKFLYDNYRKNFKSEIMRKNFSLYKLEAFIKLVFQTVFSISNTENNKVITLLGLKIKIKRKKNGVKR